MHLPRILFITNEPPHTGAAGAIFFHRLFRDYPPERLCVVTSAQLPPPETRLGCRYLQHPLAVDRLKQTRFWPWRAILRNCGASRLTSLVRIEQAVRDFAPEVVVSLMQDSWYYDLAARYARRHHLPLVLFVHDLPHGFEPVPAGLAASQLRRDAQVFRQAAVRFCVSAGMAAWFQQAYGVEAEVLLPPRDDEGPAQSPATCRTLKSAGHLVLGYAGGLHYGYGEQLLALLPVLRETGTRLEFFGPSPGGVVAALRDATDVIRFNGYAPTPAAAWRTLLDRCDAILLPYLNPPGAHERQYRTHFPSKLGDCLTLGLPLLVTGPEYASGLAWCRAEGDIASLVTDPSPAAFRDAILRLRDDPERRMALATRGQAVATTFAAGPLRARLHRQLSGLRHV